MAWLIILAVLFVIVTSLIGISALRLAADYDEQVERFKQQKEEKKALDNQRKGDKQLPPDISI